MKQIDPLNLLHLHTRAKEKVIKTLQLTYLKKFKVVPLRVEKILR